MSEYIENFGILSFSGLTIPTAITLPSRNRQRVQALDGAILLIPGSLVSDVNGDYPILNLFSNLYAHLARQLAGRGYAVYRFAQLGPGTDTAVTDRAAARTVQTWKGRELIARAALAEMHVVLKWNHVQARRFILVGHGEGAVIASFMATSAGAHTVRGVVLLSCPSTDALEITREQVAQWALSGGPEPARSTIDAGNNRTPAGLALQQAGHPCFAFLSMILPEPLTYIRECSIVDPTSAAANVEQPVLIVHGERDELLPPHHAERIRAKRDATPGRATEFRVFPHLQHTYARVPEELVGQEGACGSSEPDIRVAAAIDEWIRRMS